MSNRTFALTSSGSVITIGGTREGDAPRWTDRYDVTGGPVITMHGDPYRVAWMSIDENGRIEAGFVRVTRKDGRDFRNGMGMWQTLRGAENAPVLSPGMTREIADAIVADFEMWLTLADAYGSERTHVVLMVESDDYAREHYGITHKSACVYRVAGSSAPTRVKVWDNTRRPNTRNGEPIRWTEFGPRDGGNGRYLDPHNHATDARVSVLLSPESSVISAHRNGTGTAASGQVWAVGNARLRTGDALLLVRADGTYERLTVRLTNNGHGVAE